MICRVLIVGLGSIGKRHLRLARELLPNADIRILRHLNVDEVPEYADGCFESIEKAVEFAPQVAVIANPAPFHIYIAEILASIGTHMLIEKPLAISTKGIERLLEICKSHGVILAIGYNLRLFSSLQRFRELLDDGVIGRVMSVRSEAGQYLPSWRPESDYRQSVSAKKELGGGVLLELSHELDYLRWIFGEVQWVSAALMRQGALEVDVEDTAHLTLGFLKGFGGHQLIGTVNLDFIRCDAIRLCTAIGENGSLRWNGLSGVVEIFKSEAAEWQELFRLPEQRDDSYMKEWKLFLRSISLHLPAMVTGEDGLRVLEIIEAARQSDLSGGVRFNVIPSRVGAKI